MSSAGVPTDSTSSTGPGARLAASPLLTANEIAEGLWLASRTDLRRADAVSPGARVGAGQPVREPAAEPHPLPPGWSTEHVPAHTPNPLSLPVFLDWAGEGVGAAAAAAAALPDATGLARALRPLKQFVHSTHQRLLDETATAERAAADQLWLPELTAAPELRWDAVAIVDDHLSMAVWRDVTAEFVALLRRQGAFRDVSLQLLDTDGTEPAQVRVRTPGVAGRVASSRELLVPTGRRIVFIVTDGIGPAWQSGAVTPLLRIWARHLPVVIIQLLPQQHWYRTGLRPHRLRLRAPAIGAPNSRLRWRPSDPLTAAMSASGPLIPIPVLELRSKWLAPWAKMVAGQLSGPVRMTGLLAGRWEPPAETDQQWPPWQATGDARERVRDFTASATPIALKLASHLAAAPLNLPVMRMLQHATPGSDTSHLAEIVNSGLIRPVVPPARLADRAQVTFEFEDGVREELLATGRRAETAQILRMVEHAFHKDLPALAGVSRVLADPASAPPPTVSRETAPFLHVEQAVMRALSGPYLARANDLQLAFAAVPPPTTPPYVATVHPRPVDTGQGQDSRKGNTVPDLDRLDRPDEASFRPPAILGNVPPRNPNFTGREELLVRLEEMMQTGPAAVLPHALHGMGGVGKSQLAVEYVYQHQNEYDLIWWVPAERQAQIGASLVELAQRMGLDVGPEVGSAVPAVREALRVGKPYRNWLLVFDNAESPDAVRSYFPTGGHGSIMVTSRNPNWSSVAQPLEVGVFTREESIALLRRRGPELDDAEANRLADTLGDLPLALEQAAAWRAETGMPTEEYLRLFDEKLIELLEMSPPVDYPYPVAAAWNVSLDRLVHSSPAALRLLQVCSFFAAEPIARSLLAGAHNTDVHPELNDALRDPLRLNRAIREINRYSLARIDFRTNSIQMHRLIQKVLIGRMPEAERTAIRQGAHRLLASADRNDPYSPENWRTYNDLYPHALESSAVHSNDPWVQQLVDNIAKYLYYWGDYRAAKAFAQEAYNTRRTTLGLESHATLSAGRWLGFMLFVVGDYSEAAQLNAEVLAAHQRTTSDDTEELLAAIGAVAADRRVAGDFKGALEIDEDLYQRHVRALGADDPATLNAAHNLAVSLRLVGELARARDLDQETWHRRQLLFGEDHAFTLQSRINLITDHRELGEYRDARVLQEQVVDRLRQALSPGNPQTLKALQSLASAIRKAGDHEAARAMSEAARSGFAQQYGEDHPDTVTAAVGLTIDLRATGDLAGAVELGVDVYERYRRLFGDRHPHAVAARLNLAVTHRLSGDVALARQFNEEGLATLADTLGFDHPLTLACAVNLGSDLYLMGEHAAAYERDSDTVERLRRVLGEDHPTTLICLGNLAMDLTILGHRDEAEALHADIVDRFYRVLGKDHAATEAGTDLTRRGDCDLDPLPL